MDINAIMSKVMTSIKFRGILYSKMADVRKTQQAKLPKEDSEKKAAKAENSEETEKNSSKIRLIRNSDELKSSEKTDEDEKESVDYRGQKLDTSV